MFGKRKDGELVRGLDPISKATPYFMPRRYDALNMMEESFPTEGLDAYIKQQSKEHGVTFTYMHVMLAAIVRLYALRPLMNRFVVNCKLYQRNDITISITVKKELSDTGEECLIKLHFKGTESIYEVKEIVDKALKENLKKQEGNGTEFGAKLLGAMPGFMFKFALGIVKLLDRWELLPKWLIEASPFHTGIYFTNLKSIKNDAVFHHIYDFGTCGMFVSMGKEKMAPVVVDNSRVEVVKMVNLGVTMDERVCDGFYFAKSLRIFKKIMQDPSVLNNPLDLPEPINPAERRKKAKAEKKAKKQAEKQAKKQEKIERKQAKKSK
ncbi:MAG: 2-oxo acid dehydrogenase subunit E2 [Clostridiales bacterium]|nr:2-oxo acid dehydrogenase subunit E2 [Clostridiales bacterium]